MTKHRTTEPHPANPPTWDQYWATVKNESYLYARELIEMSWPVKGHFASYITWRDEPVRIDDPADPPYTMPDPTGLVWRDADLDWKDAAVGADGWAASSTERRLLDLILSMVQPNREWDYDKDRSVGERRINVQDLADMGSWQEGVANIMCRYMLGQPPRRS